MSLPSTLSHIIVSTCIYLINIVLILISSEFYLTTTVCQIINSFSLLIAQSFFSKLKIHSVCTVYSIAGFNYSSYNTNTKHNCTLYKMLVLGRCSCLLIILSLTSLESALTEMRVVGTDPQQYPGKDGVAWLSIDKMVKLTVCMRFKITQYYNLYDSVHPLIELSKANRIWAVTNKCHKDNKKCTTGFIKRFKDDYKLGKTFGLFIYNYKFEEFDSWLPGRWNSLCILLDQTREYYGVFLNGKKRLEFDELTRPQTTTVRYLY